MCARKAKWFFGWHSDADYKEIPGYAESVAITNFLGHLFELY